MWSSQLCSNFLICSTWISTCPKPRLGIITRKTMSGEITFWEYLERLKIFPLCILTWACLLVSSIDRGQNVPCSLPFLIHTLGTTNKLINSCHFVEIYLTRALSCKEASRGLHFSIWESYPLQSVIYPYVFFCHGALIKGSLAFH